MALEVSELEERLFGLLVNTYENSTGHELRQLNEYETGKTVFREGILPRGVYFIKSGRVKVVRKSLGTAPSMYRIAGPGEFAGFLSLIRETPYQASATALESSEIWFIGRNIFFKTMREDLSFANGFIRMLCERLKYAEDHIDDLKTKDVRQRLATTLLSLSVSLNGAKDDHPVVDLMRKDLANIVAVTPETLSRQLKKMESENLISLNGRGIVLRDVPGLIHIGNLGD